MAEDIITQFSDSSLNDADPKEVARRFVCEIENSERAFDDYFKRCRKINKRYLDERGDEAGNANNLVSKRKYNILWSNIQTALPAVYSQVPKPYIDRRFRDPDPVSRVASQILERSAEYSLSCDDFDGRMRNSTLDYLLFARSCAWLRYKPFFAEKPESDAEEEAETPQQEDAEDVDAPDDLNDDEQGDDEAELAYEEAPYDYIHREDFLHSVARCWDEVWWVARKVYLTRQECIERFGDEIGKNLPLDSFPETVTDSMQKSGKFNYLKKARIYELWCKSNRTVYWISKSYSQGYLDSKEDWLKLRDFFPCPRPAYGTLGNDTLIPTPDFIEYQDQADEMDDLSQRIKMLSKALKAAGIYDGSVTGLKELLNEGQDFTLIPVENWAMVAEKGGIQGVISWWPADQIAKVLLDLFQARDACKQEIYEITGFSDIMRGASEASETATAQSIKSQYGSMRLRDKQREIQRFARDIVRLKCEIIAEHFSPQTLMLMSNIQLPSKPTPEQMQMAQQAQAMGQPSPPIPEGPYIEDVIDLLRNDGLRGFKIDIETDSTILADQQQEKQLRTEFLQSVGGFLQEAVPLGTQIPQMMPLLGQLLMFGVRGFGGSTRQLEQPFEDALAQLEKQSQQPQPPKQDPAVQVAQINQQTDQQKMQAEQQNNVQKLALQQQQAKDEIAADIQKHQMTLQNDVVKHKMTLAQSTGDAAMPGPGDVQAQQFAQQQQQTAALAQALQGVAQTLALIQQQIQTQQAPKQVVVDRGPDGRMIGARQVPMQ